MIIRVYAHLDKESLYEYGKQAGLEGKALNYFCYFNEVEMNLAVDAENGAITMIEVKQP